MQKNVGNCQITWLISDNCSRCTKSPEPSVARGVFSASQRGHRWPHLLNTRAGLVSAWEGNVIAGRFLGDWWRQCESSPWHQLPAGPGRALCSPGHRTAAERSARRPQPSKARRPCSPDHFPCISYIGHTAALSWSNLIKGSRWACYCSPLWSYLRG